MGGFCSSTQPVRNLLWAGLHCASSRAQNSNDMIKDLCGLFFGMSGSKFKRHDQGLCLSEKSIFGSHAYREPSLSYEGRLFSLPTVHSFWTLQHTSVLLEVDFQYNKNYSSSSALSRTCYNYCQTMVVWGISLLSHTFYIGNECNYKFYVMSVSWTMWDIYC
jgi:hypothetical protein